VSLNGGFFRPGLYWIDPHTSLWEAVQLAGGTQRADGFKKLKWERNSVVLNDNLVPLLQEGKSLYQIGFMTGDQITIVQRPQQTGWEIFKNEVLPILTLTLSTSMSVFTAYNSIQMYQNYRSR
jgi:protein involved in polysaccharide export with SLBB domain